MPSSSQARTIFLVAAWACVGPSASLWANVIPFLEHVVGQDAVDDAPADHRPRRRRIRPSHHELARAGRAGALGDALHPPPAGVRPTLASTSPKAADSAAQIISQASAASNDAVRQSPWTIARVGMSRVSKAPQLDQALAEEALGLGAAGDPVEDRDVDAAGEDLALGPPDQRPGIGGGDLVDAPPRAPASSRRARG